MLLGNILSIAQPAVAEKLARHGKQADDRAVQIQQCMVVNNCVRCDAGLPQSKCPIEFSVRG